MTATIAGTRVAWRSLEVVTTPRTARALLEVAPAVMVESGDPLTLAADNGSPLLTAEVAAVQRDARHRRIVAVPAALLDMSRRTVDPVTHDDAQLTAVLADVLGPHTVAALPPFDALLVAHWSTRERTQRWALASVLHTLAHLQRPAQWRYDARGDRLVIAAPDDDAERTDHDPTRLQWHGSALEVPARTGVQAGDLVMGQRVRLVRTFDGPGYSRSMAWLTD